MENTTTQTLDTQAAALDWIERRITIRDLDRASKTPDGLTADQIAWLLALLRAEEAR